MAAELTLTLEKDRFDRAVSRFLRNKAPAVVKVAVRKLAFDVVAETTKGLNGLGGLPKRIDTGRLRAGWRVAMADGGLPTFGLPSSASSKASDGSANMSGSGVDLTITVTNRVNYAAHVEHGTVHMIPPGKHLERALRLARTRLPRDTRDGLGPAMRRAFNEPL